MLGGREVRDRVCDVLGEDAAEARVQVENYTERTHENVEDFFACGPDYRRYPDDFHSKRCVAHFAVEGYGTYFLPAF